MTILTQTEIAPVDYSKESNEFVFTLEDYILRVNYNDKTFQLVTPENIAYDESFDFMDEPADWFQIDHDIEKWIGKALKWNRPRIRQEGYITYEIDIAGMVCIIDYSSKKNDLVITIPGRTIITQHEKLLIDYPELAVIDYGELNVAVTNNVYYEIQGVDQGDTSSRMITLPLEFHPRTIKTSQNSYKFDLVDLKILYIKLPDRKIRTNLLLIESDAPEIAIYDKHAYEAIRNLIREKNINNS